MTVKMTLKLTSWRAAAVKAAVRDKIVGALNEAGADGVTLAQQAAPRDTGFMANTIEVTHTATPSQMYVEYGNITALYTLWQEIGARGRPGHYFLRNSLQKIQGPLMKRIAGKLR